MTAGTLVTLNVTFVSEDAAYANTMGWYNSRTGEAGILFLDLNDDGKHAGVHSGDARTLTVLQSDLDAGSIGFFLVPDGSNEFSDATLSSPMQFVVGANGDGKIVIDRPHGSDVVLKAGDGDVLFSDRQYNKGDYDYVSGTVGTDGQTKAQKFGEQSDGADGILGTVAWDDQVVQSGNKGTDRDFNDVVLKVSLANAAPTDITLTDATVDENAAGAVIGILDAVDPDSGDTATFETDDARFVVVGDELRLADGVALDYEATPEIVINVTATDSHGATFTKQFTITVADVDEAPSEPVDVDGADNTVSEMATLGDAVGITVSSIDPQGTAVTYTLIDDPSGLFAVDPFSGTVTVNTALDFDAAGQHIIVVRATDADGEYSDASFTIDVTNVQQFAIDGYIANAVVFADANNDGRLSEGEAFTTTDTFGKFDLASGGARLVLTGGIDIATGLPIQGSLTAMAGSTHITALTTLLVKMEDAGFADPNGTLAVALGLPLDTDFNHLDPIAAAAADPAPFVAATEILNSVIMAASLVAGSSMNQVSLDQAIAAAFATLASQLFDGPIDLIGSESLLDLINGTADATGVDVDDTLAEDTAAVIAASNININDIAATAADTGELLVGVSAASIVAQGETAEAIAAVAAGAPNALITDYVDGLDDLVNAAVSQVGNTTGTGTAGDADANTPTLTDGNDTYDGAGGDDIINGLKGNDLLLGGADKDTIAGDEGNDILEGGDGDDILVGGADNDALIGGAGTDLLDGGAGDDIYYHSGIASVDGHDVIEAEIVGVDKIVFTVPVLYDAFPERNGDDLIVGVVLNQPPTFPYDGTVTVKDFYSSTALGIFVEFDGPYNAVYSTDPSTATMFVTRDITSGIENATYTEILFGDDSDNAINGNGGFYDGIFAGGGKDTVHGGEGFDNIRGGDNDDKLYGDEGDDTLRGEGGDDYLDGGAGNDTVRYSSGTLVAAVWADLESGIGKDLKPGDNFLGTDTFVSIENLRGSDLGDELYGDGEENRLRGQGGDDLLVGRGGNDTLEGGAGADEYSHSGTAADGDDTVHAFGGDGDYIVFTTPDLYDLDFFRDGSDLVVGAYLPDGPMTGSLRIVDHYAGAAISYVQIDTELYNLLYGTDANTSKFLFSTDVGNGLDDNDTVEVLLGTQDDDEIHGNGGFYDALYGNAGNDKLYGEGGFDHLRAGSGDDELYGGEGNDRLRGDQDNDHLDGGEGIDLARYDRGSGAVEVDLAAGFAKDRDLNGNSGQDTLTNVEEVRASNFDDLVLGDGGANLLEGRGGDDYLDGRTGQDDLRGDDGNDVLWAEDGEQDHLDGGSGNDTLITDGTLDILVGGDGSDIFRITGFAASVADLSRIVDFDFAPGQDRIDLSMWIGGFIPGVSDPAMFVELVQDGADTILRLDGTGSGTNFLDMVVIENFSTDLATLVANGSLLMASQFGTPDPDIVTLTGAADIFDALGGDDEITALGGNDLLIGGEGNDKIEGGTGTDEYRHSGTLADGDDTITTGEDGIDYIVFTTPELYDLDYFREGDDLVVGAYLAGTTGMTGSVRVVGHYTGAAIGYVQIDTELYNLFYGTDADASKFYFATDIANGGVHDDGAEVLLGTAVGETINGNGGFYDALYGLGGDDVLNGGLGTDWLRGGEDKDELNGGEDNDHLRGDEGDDTLDGGIGIDRARYNNATGGVEVDLLAGTADQRDLDGNSGHDTLKDIENVQGSNFADLLSGDDDINNLQGQGGDDTLNGRGGDDLLIGANGVDELFGGADNDFAFGGNDGDTVDGGLGDDFLTGDGGDDKIAGGEGFDTLDGGDDSDVLNGGADIDTLTGGAGADTFAFSHASANGGPRNDDYITDYNYFEGDVIDLSDLLEDDEIDPGQLGAIFIILPTDEGTGISIDADGPGSGSAEFVVNIGNISADTPITFKVDDTYYNYDGNIIT